MDRHKYVRLHSSLEIHASMLQVNLGAGFVTCAACHIAEHLEVSWIDHTITLLRIAGKFDSLVDTDVF